MGSIFTKIINKEIPSYKIAESEDYYAFLDINPIALGHTLVIPKKEVDYVFDLDDDTLSGLHLFSKKVAEALRAEVECLRVGVMVAGLEVPHAHVHLVPMNDIHDLSFSNPRVEMSQEEFQALADRVNTRFETT